MKPSRTKKISALLLAVLFILGVGQSSVAIPAEECSYETDCIKTYQDCLDCKIIRIAPNSDRYIYEVVSVMEDRHVCNNAYVIEFVRSLRLTVAEEIVRATSDLDAYVFEMHRELNEEYLIVNVYLDTLGSIEMYELISRATAPSRPHCINYSMSLVGINIKWGDYNADYHWLRTINIWKCNKPGCVYVTDVIEEGPLVPHNFAYHSDGGHIAGTNTHRRNNRCQQCGRAGSSTYPCPGNPCVYPRGEN